MADRAWREIRLEEALARPELKTRARQTLALGPLCDHCSGRLFAAVGTGMSNADRGRTIRRLLKVNPPRDSCRLCGGLFGTIGTWVDRARQALAGWEFDTFLVASRIDPQIAKREQAIWDRIGGDLAEPYKQAFNREVGGRLCNATGREPDLTNPDILAIAHHRVGKVTVEVRPFFVSGRYRKLVRGLPQCRWPAWPTSVQQIIGDPVRRAAAATDHTFHGCGREDVDVRCLGERPFVLEVTRPRRRRLDWPALTETINRSGRVEVVGLEPCTRREVVRLKGLRPDKSYRALVQLAEPVEEKRLDRLADLVGRIRQRTPRRVAKRRSNRLRLRRLQTLHWRRIDRRSLEVTVRTEAGLYIKELISGDEGLTRPSVAEVLGVGAVCTELDVIAVHAGADGSQDRRAIS